MNVSKRTKDFKLLVVEALFRHVNPAMRKDVRLQQELSKRTAGYFGEKQVDYMLRIYPDSNAVALADIGLTHKNYNFQMDTAILTPQRHIILETKNWAGELEYDPGLRQLVQLHNGQKKRYPCPIAQAEKQKLNWTGWFLEHGFPVLPIEAFVVISNSSTILSNPQQDQYFSEKVFHADLLHEKLDTLLLPNMKKAASTSMVRRMSRYMNVHKTHRYDNMLAKMNLSGNQLIRGIPCEKCWHHPMIRQARSWLCTHCGHKDKNAHIQAVYDYFLINRMKPITNREVRIFLNVPNRRITYTLLQNMKLKMMGTGRHAIYHAPPLERFPQSTNLPPS